MITPQQLALAFLCVKPKKTKVPETIKTDTGISSYYYIVVMKDGRKRRMHTIAENLAKAEHYAALEVEAYGGRIITKLKKAKTFEWQRPV